MFGLPGDFNLTLLDQMLTVEDVEWVGTTNELNASYAADAYARVGRRLGAVVTTFGVGELSAINGLAGSYAEDVPVVHIVGMPSTSAMERGLPLHHTVLDGDFERGVRVAREFTVAQAVLGRTGAATDIDRVLTAVLTASKPGFLGIPLDVAALPVAQEVDPSPLTLTGSRPDALAAFEKALRSHVDGAATATLLAGPRIHRRGLEHLVRALADLPGVQVASQSGSKAILDECHPASLGTYLAATSVDAATRDLVDGAELLIMVGTVTSDFTTGFFSNRYVAEEAVELGLDSARIGYAHYPGVMLHDALAALHRVLEAAQLQPRDAHVTTATGRRPEAYGVPGADTGPEAHGTAAPEPDAPLDHAALWPAIQQWIWEPASPGPTTGPCCSSATAPCSSQPRSSAPSTSGCRRPWCSCWRTAGTPSSAASRARTPSTRTSSPGTGPPYPPPSAPRRCTPPGSAPSGASQRHWPRSPTGPMTASSSPSTCP